MRKIDKQPFPGLEEKNFFDEKTFLSSDAKETKK
jgi:hypothetical protein